MLGSDAVFAVDSDSFTAGDVRIESRGGKVSDITVDPELTYRWSGLDASPSTVSFLVAAKLRPQSTFQTVASESVTVTSTALDGEGTYAFQNGAATAGGGYSLLENTDGSITAADFEPENGQQRTRTVDLRVTATLSDTDGRAYTSTRTASYDVTVIKQTGPPNGNGSQNGNGGT